jgi:hypothetical protein
LSFAIQLPLNACFFYLVRRNMANKQKNDITSQMPTFKSRLKFFIPSSLAIVLAAYALTRLGAINLPRHYDPFALPDLAERPNFLTSFKLKLVDSSVENCRMAFSNAGKLVKIEPTQLEKPRCMKQDTIKLASLSVAKLRSEETRCAVAARLFMWEKNIVQPAAMRHFNEPVAEILHFGSYSCRTMRRSSAMSEHATANAFDIAGFQLRSGKLVTVRQNWQGTGPTAKFLHDVRGGACDYFNLVLSPDYNADHADHLHVDMGWIRGCH